LGTAFCRRNASRYDIVAAYNTRLPRLVSQTSQLIDPLAPAERLPENAWPVYAVQADLTRDADVIKLVDVALARFGRIDVLVNAAAHTTHGSALDERLFPVSLERHLAVNVVGAARLAVTIARRYWQDRQEENRLANRNIVNISSTSGLYVYPDLGQSAYSTSKAALNFLTMHLASELEVLNVRVNATAPNTFPGLVPTERVIDAILRLDQGEMNGRILLLDKDEENLI
jgi:NAD(P)-dependent dehydrogenase (short-subunit alcohol dehydrogenase family)